MNRSIGILKDGTRLIGSNIGVNFFSILISIYIVRTVDKVELALIPISMVLIGITGSVVSLGLPSSVLRLVPEFSRKGETEKRASLLAADIFTTNLFLFIILFLFYFNSDHIIGIFLKEHAFLVNPVFFVPLIFFGANYTLSALRMQSVKEFSLIGRTILLTQISQRLLLVPFYHLFGPSGILFSLSIGYALGTLCYFHRLLRYLSPKTRLFPGFSILKFSFPFYLYGIVRFLSTKADYMLISILLKPEQLATYFIAYKVISYFLIICESVLRPIAPRLAEVKHRGRDALESAYHKVSRWVIIIFVTLAGFTILFARPLLDLYAGDNYSSTWPILIILALAMIPFAFSFFHQTWLMILAPPSKSLKLEIVSATCSLFFGYLLIQRFGPIGVAAGQLFTFTVAALISKKFLGNELTPSIDWKMLRIIVTSLLPYAIASSYFTWISYDLKMCLLILPAGGLLFLFLLFGRMEEGDRELIQEYLPKKLRFIYKLWPMNLLRPAEAPTGSNMGIEHA